MLQIRNIISQDSARTHVNPHAAGRKDFVDYAQIIHDILSLGERHDMRLERGRKGG